jgi:hypothetical protein
MSTTILRWIIIIIIPIPECVNNLVVALIINKFLQQLAHSREESTVGVEHIGQSVHISDDRAIFDASKVTGTVTNVHGDYIARFRQSQSDMVDEQRDRERLRMLFTQTSTMSVDE